MLSFIEYLYEINVITSWDLIVINSFLRMDSERRLLRWLIIYEHFSLTIFIDFLDNYWYELLIMNDKADFLVFKVSYSILDSWMESNYCWYYFLCRVYLTNFLIDFTEYFKLSICILISFFSILLFYSFLRVILSKNCTTLWLSIRFST